MPAEDPNDLAAFLAVACERSFTRAAAKLGVSQSALSQTVRGLEARLGIRLLTRSTRSVAPTEAGERLLQTVGPRLAEIQAEIEQLSELRDKPAGTIRITAGDHAIHSVLTPKLAKILPGYPSREPGPRGRPSPGSTDARSRRPRWAGRSAAAAASRSAA
jgi:DNA-binding transcriptional LysR family regulator